MEKISPYSETAALALEIAAASKFLFRTSEAKAALGIGNTKLYELINKGVLEARRMGKRTYITAESMAAFIASLPAVETPTMARAKHATTAESQPATRPPPKRLKRPKSQEIEPARSSEAAP